MAKRFISMVLALVLLIGVSSLELCVNAWAEEQDLLLEQTDDAAQVEVPEEEPQDESAIQEPDGDDPGEAKLEGEPNSDAATDGQTAPVSGDATAPAADNNADDTAKAGDEDSEQQPVDDESLPDSAQEPDLDPIAEPDAEPTTTPSSDATEQEPEEIEEFGELEADPEMSRLMVEGYIYELAGMDITGYDPEAAILLSTPLTVSETAVDNLDYYERKAYDYLKTECTKVANGQRNSTIFDLPVDYGNLNIRKVVLAVRADLPYAMYWWGLGFNCSNGNKLMLTVAEEFRGSSQYMTNIPNVPKAVANAKAVVSNNSKKTDYGKLLSYKEYICNNTDYNKAALSDDYPYGNPWQLLWVFDNDSSTKVVCEGYSKAFKYLCDLTDEQYGWDASVEALLATGETSGPHMWNMVSIDGSNYLVDVTNCDGGWDLFLRGGRRETNVSFSIFLETNEYLNYTYSTDTAAIFDSSQLTISSEDYMGEPKKVTMKKATASKDGVTVTWYADKAAEWYRVYRRVAGESWMLLDSYVVDTSYFDADAEAGITYYYTVEAANAAYTSSSMDQNGVSVTMPKIIPADVKLVSAVAVNGGISVTWEKAANARHYRIYRKAPGEKKWATIKKTFDGTCFTDTDVESGKSYTYTVRGLNGTCISKSYDKTGVSAGLPATVKLATIKVEKTGITVTWKAAACAEKYRVYRKAAGDTKWTTVAKSVSGTKYVDKKAESGIKYTYTVRGITDGVLSAKYDKAGLTATMVKIVPANVTLTSAVAETSGITVKWKAAANAYRYQVYRKASGDKKWKTLTKTATGTSYVDTTAEAGVLYTYTVRGLNGKSISAKYDGTGVTTGIPANVTLKKASVSKNNIVVTWSAAANATSYRVYRKAVDDAKWTTVAKSTKGTSYTDTTAAWDVDYVYTVRGIRDKALSPSYNAAGVAAGLYTVPDNVKLVSAVADVYSIIVTWEETPHAQTYRIYRKTADTKWAAIADRYSGTRYVDTTAEPGVEYIYTVRAWNRTKISAGYDGTGVSDARPGSVKLRSVTATVPGEGVTITWAPAKNADSYSLLRKTADTNWITLAEGITATSYVDKSVEDAVQYTYTVRDKHDGSINPTYDTTGLSVIIPAKVEQLAAEYTGDGFTVTWDAVDGAETYQVWRKAMSDKAMSDEAWVTVGEGISGTSFTDTAIQRGVRYLYTVLGTNSNAISSSFCSETQSNKFVVTPDGVCGENLTWTLADGVLTISGNGAMADFDHVIGWDHSMPWYPYQDEICSVVVNEGVTTIGNNAFYWCKSLKTVDLPKTITQIGHWAFGSCSGLAEIVLPTGLSEIEYGAFYGCTSMKQITLPAGLKKIGSNTFNGSGMQSLSIPVSVTDIDNGGGLYSKNLKTVYYKGTYAQWLNIKCDTAKLYENTKVLYRDNLRDEGTSGTITWKLSMEGDLTVSGSGEVPALFEYDFKQQIKTITIEEGITAIGEWAFSNCNAVRATLPGTLKSIERLAFYSCKNLTHISLPESVTKIGEEAFAATGLLYISFPDGIETIEEKAFEYCVNLTRVDLPKNLKVVEDYAFNNTMLQQIDIPDGVTEIGKQAFRPKESGDRSWVNVPVSVTTMGSYPFWVNTIYYQGTKEQWEALARNMVMSSSVVYGTKKELNAFGDGTCGDNVYWKLADGTLHIYGEGAMEDYKRTSSDTPWEKVCADIKQVIIGTGITHVGDYAFRSCENLQRVIVNEGVESIGIGAFNYCSALESVYLSEGLKLIEEGAFSGCTALRDLTLPDTLKTIQEYAFANEAMPFIIIPDGVEEIGYGAFSSSESASYVVLPASLKEVASSAFNGHSEVSDVYYAGTKSQAYSIRLSSCFSYSTTIHYNSTGPT